MRLVKVTQYYGSYLRDYEARFPAAASLGYSEQLAALLRDCFDWGFFWQDALPPFGYEFDGIVINAESLQKAWARENGLEISPEKWREEIVIAQLKKLEPDIIWFDDLHLYRGAFVRELRALFPKVRLWMAWSGSPPPPDVDLAAHDLILSNIPGQVRDFGAAGACMEYLAHAFSPKVLELLGQAGAERHPFTFVGSISFGAGGHNSRLELLSYLAPRSPLAVHSIMPKELTKKPGKNRYYHRLAQISSLALPRKRVPVKWRTRQAAHLLSERIRAPFFGLEMFRLLQHSEVSLNQHIDISRREASNMRLFEGTGAGTCLLTDRKENLADFFEPDKEVATYDSPEECLEKFNWLAEHPRERAAMAAAGQRRTLAQHTFANRAPQLDSLIRKHLPKK
jgi:spore maturation protein CgeB